MNDHRSVLSIDEVIKLSRPLRAFIRCSILLLVLINTALLAAFAMIYLHNNMPDSLLWLFRSYFLYSESDAFLMSYSTTIGLSYAVLSAIFGMVALRILRVSTSTRRTRIGPTELHPDLHTPRKRSALLARPASAFQWFRLQYNRWHRAVGVRGPYFDLRLVVGELLEIASQTAAALSASQSIGNAPLNIIYAVVIFLNCISASVFHCVFKTSTIKARIACLLSDIVLDFVWGTLLPVWMYRPIVNLWLDREHIIDYMESFSNSTREIERILIVSWKMYVLSIIPFLSSCSSLLKLHNALEDVSVTKPSCEQQPLRGSSQRPSKAGQLVRRARGGGFVRATHVLFPVYGLTILVLTLRANGIFHSLPMDSRYDCIHRVHPWFATKESCLSRQINCTRLGILGTLSEVDQAMDLFDEESLSDLIVVGCRGFEMPPRIQSFKRITSIIIKNSTIVQWSEAAMVRGEVFPEIRSVQLKGVQFVHEPIGLSGVGPIAPSIEWIYMEHLDGSRVLPFVGDHWNNVRYFICRACGLTSFPNLLYEMPWLLVLGLSDNNLASIPDDWTERTNVHLEVLLLDGNPRLTQLAESVWHQSSSARAISMVGTNLSVIPDWIPSVAGREFMLLAIATPICYKPTTLPPYLRPRVVCS